MTKRVVNKNYVKSFKNIVIGRAEEKQMGFRTITEARSWGQEQVKILLDYHWLYKRYAEDMDKNGNGKNKKRVKSKKQDQIKITKKLRSSNLKR